MLSAPCTSLHPRPPRPRRSRIDPRSPCCLPKPRCRLRRPNRRETPRPVRHRPRSRLIPHGPSPGTGNRPNRRRGEEPGRSRGSWVPRTIAPDRSTHLPRRAALRRRSREARRRHRLRVRARLHHRHRPAALRHRHVQASHRRHGPAPLHPRRGPAALHHRRVQASPRRRGPAALRRRRVQASYRRRGLTARRRRHAQAPHHRRPRDPRRLHPRQHRSRHNLRRPPESMGPSPAPTRAPCGPTRGRDNLDRLLLP